MNDKAKREKKNVPNLWDEEVSVGNLRKFSGRVFFVFRIWEVSYSWRKYKYANWGFKGLFSKMRGISYGAWGNLDGSFRLLEKI